MMLFIVECDDITCIYYTIILIITGGDHLNINIIYICVSIQ